MSSCCSTCRSRVVCPVALPLLLVLLLLLSPCSSAELNVAAVPTSSSSSRRLLVSRPSTSRQKAQQQQMPVGGRNTPFKQAAASFGRKRVPKSGWNPIQNR